MSDTTIPLLRIREIQAGLTGRIFDALVRHVGTEKARSILKEAIEEDARAAGSNLARDRGRNDLETFAAVIREVWARDGALELEDLTIRESVLTFRVVRCRYAEMYARLGLRDLGTILSCARDAAFAQGFNPSFRMERSRIIMAGEPCCDFRFEAVEKTTGKENG